MRTRKYKRNRLMADINIVPYIDVMLVLLIIFMITAPLLTQGITVSLPQAKAKTISDKNNIPLVVSVNAKGQYFLNVAANPKVPISPQALATRVAAEIQLAKQEGQRRQVLVKGDKNVAYGKVVQAMVLLKNTGVANVGLMTQTPQNLA